MGIGKNLKKGRGSRKGERRVQDRAAWTERGYYVKEMIGREAVIQRKEESPESK